MTYERGDIYKNVFGDEVIVIGMIPVATKVKGKSNTIHEDDLIDVTDKSIWRYDRNIFLTGEMNKTDCPLKS